MTALFPGPRWTSDQIAEGLMRAGFTGWSVRTMGAIVQAESLGYVWAHGLNHEGSGTPATSPAYLAEGHGLVGMDDYWIPEVWGQAHAGDPGLRLLLPFWTFERSFSQLAKDPEWNLAMTRQVFLLNALTRGYANAYEGWTSYRLERHLPFLAEATAAARRAGAIT